jgi:uncharacterized protein (TIGR00255 family)
MPVIRSMTGFGRAEVNADTFALSVEVRSVNHRHLEVALRFPRVLSALEPEARRVVQSRLERGRIDVAVQFGPAPGRAVQQVRVDAALARDYLAKARDLAGTLGLGDDVPLSWVLGQPGVVRAEEVEPPDPSALWPLLEDALSRALDVLVAQRTAEGTALAAELGALASDLNARVEQVAGRAPTAVIRREDRLRERLRTLLGAAEIDETRVLTEAAIWADKTDVTEEVARLRSHLEQLRLMTDKGGPLGRPLDFLIQELNREVNTIGSKADDLEVSQAVIAAKSVLEKMREQIQNLE